jgi:hypothetical protein
MWATKAQDALRAADYEAGQSTESTLIVYLHIARAVVYALLAIAVELSALASKE